MSEGGEGGGFTLKISKSRLMTGDPPKVCEPPKALKETQTAPSVNFTLCDSYLAHRAPVSVIYCRDLIKTKYTLERHKHIYALSSDF